jgi:putative transposase
MPTASRRSQSFRRWYSRGYLPHFDAPGLIQHITFHLADSLPADALERMQAESDTLPQSRRLAARRKRIQSLLDSGLGHCVLAEAACADIVQASLPFGDGTRYRLLAWVVMPNHVHVLIEQLTGWPLAKVVQSWKRHTARRIHRLGYGLCQAAGSGLGSSIEAGRVESQPGSQGVVRSAEYNSAIQRYISLWQRDYWDRFIRSERHFLAAKQYIEENPVAAKLVTASHMWPWGSARVRASPGGEATGAPEISY